MGGRRRPLAVTLAGLALAGCAATNGAMPAYRFVEGPRPLDPAHAKIAAWQQRERAAEPGESVMDATLGADWSRFVLAERRAQVERVASWIQDEAQQRYVPDSVIDRWPTSAEVFASQGDDCDGLELLALHALRALGFPDEALFRAVIERPDDGVQHMVTLWFETPGDPVVIDPTGFATKHVLPLSTLAGWTPRAIFTEQAEFRVEGPELAPAGAPE
jgi:predicted transglutaminase-like cysteine proteinase